jgi:branched-chain amino acid transport system ATP-binding protein
VTLLRVENLSKTFGALWAVKNVSFSVEEGEIVGLIGPNGSGKSTLFHLLTGLIKPNGGRTWYKGEEITKERPYKICERGMTRTFQLVRPFSDMTVLKNVMVGRAYGSEPARSMRQVEADANHLLQLTGLTGKSTVLAGTLALVDRKKLELARALATKPKLLLLDEVMAGLNTAEMNEAVRFIKWVRESGVTLIVVEHVMKALLGMADRVIVLNAGEKIVEGTPREIAGNEEVIRVYLGERHRAGA